MISIEQEKNNVNICNLPVFIPVSHQMMYTNTNHCFCFLINAYTCNTQDKLNSIGSLLLVTLDEFALNLHDPNQEVVDSENIGGTFAFMSQFWSV